ncbi:MAG: YggS family pyridoxal phosphate-dependent enzyme [Rhodospirillales bacterium]|nr:YggS family pyridoxal phosphate-dependent enzyme [Rhodospirillales bacterium]MCB9997031.1 YggS family pyridoxal phosphate-dependent enzyme [Rhodospirillales bacterium]
MNQVAENIAFIREKITGAAKECGRDPGAVQLVAVSKRQDDDRIDAALAAGQRLFGENKVQEAQAHWQARRESYPDLRLHLIGPLQTNKVKDAVALFDCIETLDREKLALKLAEEMAAQGRDLPCFIQVNTGAELQKAGILPEYLGEFHDYCRYECGLDVQGLMCIPPADEPAALHFALLAKLAQEQGLLELSMGMSADFEKAIALGATYVRVGTALFGSRD